MKKIVGKFWIIPMIVLIATYFLTSGSQLYKVINVVDNWIFFLYLGLFINIGLIIINLFVWFYISKFTALPGFLTNSFFVELGADTLKEKGLDKISEYGGKKFSKVNEKIEKYRLWSQFKRMTLTIASMISSYYLVSKYFIETVSINNEIIGLLVINFGFIGYYFYREIKE